MRWLMTPIQAGKPWNGATIHTEPLGGSESAVAYLARALAKRGEEVHVVTHMQQDKAVFENVTYYGAHRMGEMFNQHWDILLSSRWIEILDAPWTDVGYRVLWIHDLPQNMNVRINAHRVVAISQFQFDQWHLPSESCEIIGDGVDNCFFGPEIVRNENKVLWVSNPDRGLPLACKIFQEIRKRWPDLELHVYGRSSVYGWPAEVESPFLPRYGERENVIMHDPLPRYALSMEMREAWAVFYPTYWPETYCMSTLEAQAAGTPVVASPYGALCETVKGGVLTYDFLNGISQLRSKRRWSKLSTAGVEWAKQCTWDVRAQQWTDMVVRNATK